MSQAGKGSSVVRFCKTLLLPQNQGACSPKLVLSWVFLFFFFLASPKQMNCIFHLVGAHTPTRESKTLGALSCTLKPVAGWTPEVRVGFHAVTAPGTLLFWEACGQPWTLLLHLANFICGSVSPGSFRRYRQCFSFSVLCG